MNFEIANDFTYVLYTANLRATATESATILTEIPFGVNKATMLQRIAKLKELNPDILVTCAYGQILSQEILDIPKLGVINIHASLLPKYRGASPIHYAILNGESKTGITIMKTDIGIDTGDMLLSKEITIGEEETCGELFERLSSLGSNLILTAINFLLYIY